MKKKDMEKRIETATTTKNTGLSEPYVVMMYGCSFPNESEKSFWPNETITSNSLNDYLGYPSIKEEIEELKKLIKECRELNKESLKIIKQLRILKMEMELDKEEKE